MIKSSSQKSTQWRIPSEKWQGNPRKQVAELDLKARKVLRQYDADKSGVLERNEVEKLMMDMRGGKDVTEDELEYIMRVVKQGGGVQDATNGVGPDEMNIMLSTWEAYNESMAEIEPIMRKYDLNGNGRLERNELRRMLLDLNDRLPVSDDEVDWVLSQACLIRGDQIAKPEIKKAIALWYTRVKHGKREKQRSACCVVS
mmetsp:Transcript_72451/g.172696  ORF Transcript_72451/g.172696 Transcript_72451/m.172696 type:complete len:200 (+) Transcript_72451:204-803(+)|eukprot:CAMPEP_0178382902 /NCGR_PEP_ID=MMETSP0689_2-20121128/6729_1 /TAXON_ID=160604 /ORGANISM="Amphidinium massartii, Strain CS-259" /LENGTH=199 /DNA_ID=CAMNT_0020003113 /DNA_START=137 /DNA_END=736 /DNA_ORIENTATION=-